MLLPATLLRTQVDDLASMARHAINEAKITNVHSVTQATQTTPHGLKFSRNEKLTFHTFLPHSNICCCLIVCLSLNDARHPGLRVAFSCWRWPILPSSKLCVLRSCGNSRNDLYRCHVFCCHFLEAHFARIFFCTCSLHFVFYWSRKASSEMMAPLCT